MSEMALAEIMVSPNEIEIEGMETRENAGK